MTIRESILSALFFVILIPTAQAQTNRGLTADEVARRAASTSFDVASRREQRAAAQAAVDQARAAYLPKITGQVRYSRLSETDIPTVGNLVTAPGAAAGPIPAGTPLVNAPVRFPILLDQYSLQSSLSLPVSDYLLRIPQAHAQASHNERAAALTERATELKVATDARVLYYTWVKAVRQVAVAEQALEQARAHLADAKHALDVGTASKADVLRVESQCASSELLLVRSRNLAELLEEQLRTAMHDAAPGRYEIGETLEGSVDPIDRGDDVTGLFGEAFSRRLELRALEDSASAQREAAKVARAGLLPRLDAVGSAYYANPNQRIIPQRDAFVSTWDVTVQLTFSPTDIPSAAAARRAAQAQAAALDAQRKLLADSVKIEVMQTHQAFKEAQVAIETSRRGLAAAEESYRVRRVLFQNGKATSVELTDAETELTRARLDAVAAYADLRIARARLFHATGRDVGQAKGL